MQRSPVARLVYISIAAVLLLGTALAWAQQQTAAAPGDAECLGCHTKEMLGSWGDDAVAAGMALAAPEGADLGYKGHPELNRARFDIDAEAHAQSIHGQMGITCVMCHSDATSAPHALRLKAVDCSGCHPQQSTDYARSAHGRAAPAGDAAAPSCADCHTAHDVRPGADESSPTNRKNVAGLCLRCHGDSAFVAAHPGHRPNVAGYLEGVHGRAVAQGSAEAPTCSDCHASHAVLPKSDPASPAAALNLSKTCGNCHAQAAEYDGSVHGRALARGVIEAPSCAFCHDSHRVLSKQDPASPTNFLNAEKTCSGCHDNPALAARFGLSDKVTDTFYSAFHGKAYRNGAASVANCSSCHRVHDIRGPADPAGSVHPDNLLATCGQCHPNIGPGFIQDQVHADNAVLAADADTANTVKYWFRLAYLLLIPLTIGFMLAHNLIDYVKKLKLHYARWRAEGGLLRLDRFERVLHFMLFSSFTLLIISGFCLSFGVKPPGIDGETWESIRAATHRVAASILMLWAALHFGWIFITKRGRRYFLDMIPRYWDALDALYLVLFNLGLRRNKPKFRRFSYIEKAEYWAGLWGTAVMVLTGLILWFEEPALKLIPLWGLTVAAIVHYMEAILATLAIIVWHFYAVIINPEVAPMAMQWLSGNVPDHIMEEEHALQMEELHRKR